MKYIRRNNNNNNNNNNNKAWKPFSCLFAKLLQLLKPEKLTFQCKFTVLRKLLTVEKQDAIAYKKMCKTSVTSVE